MTSLSKEVLDHIEKNLPTFELWIENKSSLQISADIFKPLIDPFVKEFPSVNIVNNNCQECIIDMLRWAKGEWKKANPDKVKEPKPEKETKPKK